MQACLAALRELRCPEEEAALRGITVVEVVGKKRADRFAAAAARAAEQAATILATRDEDTESRE